MPVLPVDPDQSRFHGESLQRDYRGAGNAGIERKLMCNLETKTQWILGMVLGKCRINEVGKWHSPSHGRALP